MAVVPPGTVTRVVSDEPDALVREVAVPVLPEPSGARLTAVDPVVDPGGAARLLVADVPELVVEPELELEPELDPEDPDEPAPEPRPVACAAATAGIASAAATAKVEISWIDLVITGPPEIQAGPQ